MGAVELTFEVLLSLEIRQTRNTGLTDLVPDCTLSTNHL